MKTYKLPPAFYADHRMRDLPKVGETRVVRETKTQVYVEMDGPAFDDLRSDTAFYFDPAIAAEMGLPGLASSARATVEALDKQAGQEHAGDDLTHTHAKEATPMDVPKLSTKQAIEQVLTGKSKPMPIQAIVEAAMPLTNLKGSIRNRRSTACSTARTRRPTAWS